MSNPDARSKIPTDLCPVCHALVLAIPIGLLLWMVAFRLAGVL